ncbi:MAG: hypothetical protein JWR68_836 [Polaromonas sp.]|nr:hypothetical protein [Polaromonas sp.]
MPQQQISILLTMNQAQASALVKLLKQVAFAEVERVAADEEEVELMRDAIQQVLKAINEAGYSSP